MVVGRVGIEQGEEIGRRKMIRGGIVKKVEASSKRSLINSCLGLFNLCSSVEKKQPNTTKLNRPPPPPSLLPPKPKINPSSSNLGNNPSGKGINHQKTMIIIDIPDDETQPSVMSTTNNPKLDTHLPPPLGLEESQAKPIPDALPFSPTSAPLFDLGGKILGTGESDIDGLLFDINRDSHILDSTKDCCSDESIWEAYLAALEEASPAHKNHDDDDDDGHNDHVQRTVIIDISDDEEEEEEELEEEKEDGEGEEEEEDDLLMMINDSEENNMMIDNRDMFSLAYGDHMLPILSYF